MGSAFLVEWRPLVSFVVAIASADLMFHAYRVVSCGGLCCFVSRMLCGEDHGGVDCHCLAAIAWDSFMWCLGEVRSAKDGSCSSLTSPISAEDVDHENLNAIKGGIDQTAKFVAAPEYMLASHRHRVGGVFVDLRRLMS